ncbi:SMEK domain-containing protein [Aeromonas caviae]|uniref:SMEK domain-containing protein n=1 Tax=Aeromonas caviae TaxID=648 RepID=UPI00355BB4F9
MALLQTYIVQRQKAGFHDMERMLEALSIHMFRALSIGELVNKNQLGKVRTSIPRTKNENFSHLISMGYH